MNKVLKIIVTIAIFVFVGIQFIRPDRENPPTDPAKSMLMVAKIEPAVATMMRTSCYDCHSNETRWPWYTLFAPGSWLVARDVREGRKRLNFSEWGNYSGTKKAFRLGRVADVVIEGEMPYKPYLLLHPDARLSDEQRKLIADWAEGEAKRLEDLGE